MQPIISIIVPVYNVEAYLRQCLDSILSQTFTAWELILVDDGSPDGSGAICDEYAGQDSRIRVFHIPNGGVSNARNVGMEAAKGDWITFIDSDDWVGDSFLKSLYEPILNDIDIEFVHGGCKQYLEDGEVSEYTHHDFYIGNNAKLLIKEFEGYVAAKLFKKANIDSNHLFFESSMNLAEDYVFTLHYILYVHKFCFCEVNDYYYRYRESSATTTKSALRSIQSSTTYVQRNIELLTQFRKAHNIKNEEIAERWHSVSNMIFFTIRDLGFWNIDNESARVFKQYIRHSPILRFQKERKRIVYLLLFYIIHLFDKNRNNLLP